MINQLYHFKVINFVIWSFLEMLKKWNGCIHWLVVLTIVINVFFICRVVVLSSRSSYHDGSTTSDDGVNLHVLTGHEATY